MDVEYWKSQHEKYSKMYAQRRLMWHEEYKKLLKARKIDAALAFGPFGRLIRPNKYDPDEAREWVDEMMEKDANVKIAKGMIETSSKMIAMIEPASVDPLKSSDSDTKTCLFCAETIKAAAIVCRYCGRDSTSQ